MSKVLPPGICILHQIALAILQLEVAQCQCSCATVCTACAYHILFFKRLTACRQPNVGLITFEVIKHISQILKAVFRLLTCLHYLSFSVWQLAAVAVHTVGDKRQECDQASQGETPVQLQKQDGD